MRPHPAFSAREIPADHALGAFRLKALCVGDLDRDFEAVMESAADIKSANPSLTWPEGLTRDQNLIDLAWHQKEFQSRRSFAWVIEDTGGSYLGCAYVYPSISGEDAAAVHWWWRTGAVADRDGFHDAFLGWLAGDEWPALDYRAEEV